jgi:ribosomal protein L37AE/L43A
MTTHWRRLRGAVRAAVAVDRATHGTAADASGRAFAYALSPLATARYSQAVALLRRRALYLLASLHAHGHLNANVSAAREAWEEMDEMARPTPQIRIVPRQAIADRRDPLPVERAREVPIMAVMRDRGVKFARSHSSSSRYRARCPLCRSTRAALSVDARRGLWHCFKCDMGGDGIAFVQQVRGVSFADAVRELAG